MSWALIPLTEEQRAIQRSARDFAREELAPGIADRDRDASFDVTLVPKLASLGFLGMMLPEEYDGLGLDTCTYLVALEEIAAVDASAAVLMSVHNSLPTQMILRYGSVEQRARFLPRMARGEVLGAFALSEPEAGSDAAALNTRAVRDGGDWVLSGTKGVGHQRERGRRDPRPGAHGLAVRLQGSARDRDVHRDARPPGFPRRAEGGQAGLEVIAHRAAAFRRHARAARQSPG